MSVDKAKYTLGDTVTAAGSVMFHTAGVRHITLAVIALTGSSSGTVILNAVEYDFEVDTSVDYYTLNGEEPAAWEPDYPGEYELQVSVSETGTSAAFGFYVEDPATIVSSAGGLWDNSQVAAETLLTGYTAGISGAIVGEVVAEAHTAEDFPDRENVAPDDYVLGLAGTMDLPALANLLDNDTLRGEPGEFDAVAYALAVEAVRNTAADPAKYLAGNSFKQFGDFVNGSYAPDFPAVANVAPDDTVDGVAGTLDLPALTKVAPSDTLRGVPGTLDLPSLSSVDPLDTLEGVPGTLDLPAIAAILSTDTLRGVAGEFNEAARNTDPGIAYVWKSKTYRIHGVDLVGIYEGGGATPFEPTGVRIVDICQAVVNYLNDSVLETSIAERGYLTASDLEDLEETRVLVKPAPSGFAQSSGGLQAKRTDYAVNVALIQRVANDAEIDAALGLLQDIEEAFRGRSLDGVGFRGIPSEIPIIYDELFLREAKVFRGLVRLTFRGVE